MRVHTTIKSDIMLPSGAPGSPLPTPYCWEYEIFIDSTRSLSCWVPGFPFPTPYCWGKYFHRLNNITTEQQEVCHALGHTISPGILCIGCSVSIPDHSSCTCVVHGHSLCCHSLCCYNNHFNGRHSLLPHTSVVLPYNWLYTEPFAYILCHLIYHYVILRSSF